MQDDIVEDPDNEFGADSLPKGKGPRMINVGIPGPGAHVPMCKHSWQFQVAAAYSG